MTREETIARLRELGLENPVDEVGRIVLAKADLRKADLKEADLRGADLRGADLRGARPGGGILGEFAGNHAGPSEVRWRNAVARWVQAGRARGGVYPFTAPN